MTEIRPFFSSWLSNGDFDTVSHARPSRHFGKTLQLHLERGYDWLHGSYACYGSRKKILFCRMFGTSCLSGEQGPLLQMMVGDQLFFMLAPCQCNFHCRLKDSKTEVWIFLEKLRELGKTSSPSVKVSVRVLNPCQSGITKNTKSFQSSRNNCRFSFCPIHSKN